VIPRPIRQARRAGRSAAGGTARGAAHGGVTARRLGAPDVAAAAWLGPTKVDVTLGYQDGQAQVLGAAPSGEAM
jgi:hypothetical protein